ncbi:crotonase/enoyl-CoA hydratase family protein [Sphingomonas sp. RHCKR47]|uniref:crotonase/enoyl-CoA hydratase family protein n=1 Tax=Sphingomonas citricola TaxID=2862498 RepID=UPI001C67DBEA|nr:crotonase/enoyl-CoA hydratase family protein [Sphingomonas citricola]MBW6522660.1 crotonase/enoyl-CoA hydratase family protein [Sphingomonas citricola]
MIYETLSTSLDRRVLVVTLDRPTRLNAFTTTMADELEHLFRGVNDDDAVGAVIVTGAGRAFCAGMELEGEGNVFGLDETLAPTMRDMRERLDEPVIRDGVRDTGGRVTLAIFDCVKPVIAAINGAAVGIGATMTLAMDFRLGCVQTRMGFVFGRLGVVPEACSSWFLPRLVGEQTALEWVLCADILDHATLRAAGLLRSVHRDRDALMTEAKALAHRIIDGRSPLAIALSRQMLKRNPALDHPLQAHLIDSLGMFYTSLGDGKEGVAAFLEKRAPVFTADAANLQSIPGLRDLFARPG